MIIIQSVRHRYTDDRQLHFADWKIGKGERWLLLGESGSGKTTLLHIMTGLLKPSEGAVSISGTDIYQLKGKEADRFRGKHIGVVFQRPHLIKSLTVAENILLAQSLAGYPEEYARVAEVLESLGIADQYRKYPHQLSQGQLQRVSIARAVINRPALVIADEPTSSLDDKNAAAVADILLNQSLLNGSTLIVATHDRRVKEKFDHTYSLQ